jgi:rhodanese-related sulfurtransferase
VFTQVVLVDVRTPAEQNVSMIPTAIRKETFERTRDAYTDHTIVAYCTIGYYIRLY